MGTGRKQFFASNNDTASVRVAAAFSQGEINPLFFVSSDGLGFELSVVSPQGNGDYLTHSAQRNG
jgi:hypothetical protein